MSAWALNKDLEALQVYSEAAGVSGRVIDAYTDYRRHLAPAWLEALVERFNRRRVAKAIGEVCAVTKHLISTLDDVAQEVLEDGDSLTEEFRRSNPFDSSFSSLNMAVIAAKGLHETGFDEAGELVRLLCLARNKSGQVASLIRQLDAPKKVVSSDVDRQALSELARQFTSALDQHVKH